MTADASGDLFAHIARTLSSRPGVTATLENATATALVVVDGCDHAGISLVGRRRRIVTVAPTDDVMVRSDELQYETSEGPCLQAIADEETVHAPDLRREERWPRWSAAVHAELGVTSALALQLFVGRDNIGCLNMYSDQPGAFSVGNRASALALSAHVAVAVAAARSEANMQSALVNRQVIGQAEGRLMQAFDISASQAFSALVRASQSRNVKLHVVCAEVVELGIRPELFG